MESAVSDTDRKQPLDEVIGAAVKAHRALAGMTLAELSDRAGVSTAMISKIERGQVSASLGTLEALAEAIGVPLVTFFAGTASHSDVAFVAAGEGMTVQRLGSGFDHVYKMIGRAEARHVGFEAFSVTLDRPLRPRPLYQHRGVEFIHVTEGEMIFRCGETSYHMRPGDSLSFECSMLHGPEELCTDRVSFVTVISKADTPEMRGA
jgi:DNA-binding XRE family transcriptional regulator